MTKKQADMLENYRRTNVKFLWECYGNYSRAKENAYNWCMEKCAKMNGISPRICTWNTSNFTFAFQFVKDGKLWLDYETSHNSYQFCIE